MMTARYVTFLFAALLLVNQSFGGIQAISLTNNVLVEGTSELGFNSQPTQSVTIAAGTGGLIGLSSFTLEFNREAFSGGYSVYLQGSTSGSDTLAILGAQYTSPPKDLIKLSSSNPDTVSAASEVDRTAPSTDDLFDASDRYQVYGANNQGSFFGQWATGETGFFGLRYSINGGATYYGYGSVTADDTATAGIGLTLGSNLYFEDSGSSITVGATPPSGGGVPEPTGLAVIGLFGCVTALQRRRRR